MYEALKYYVNILNPFSTMVTRKVNEIVGMNLPLKMICPSHGIIWRDNTLQIVEKYLQWADNYQEDQITIVYDTMWNSTRTMAEQIAAGIYEADKSATVKLMNAAKDDKNDIMTEIFRSKAILVGSPTINNGISYAIAGILEMAHGLKFKKKKAAAFGSYGWGGEAVKRINQLLTEAGFELVNDGIRIQWVPNQEAIQACREYGKEFVKTLQ